jgi:3-oxoacyl-[acyl-carrier protein] reductase
MPPEDAEEYKDYFAKTPAAPRMAEIDDIVQIVAFLCEEGSRWITGSTTCANGGAVMV